MSKTYQDPFEQYRRERGAPDRSTEQARERARAREELARGIESGRIRIIGHGGAVVGTPEIRRKDLPR